MVCFVIPAFNEVDNITALLGELVPRARDLDARVIIVDDGSTDRTFEAIQEHRQDYPITVVRHLVNRGVGGAIDSGIRVALATVSDDDVIVTLEADGTSDLDDLPAMFERLAQGYDVVLASFFAPGGRLVGVNGLRVGLSKTLATLLRLTTRLKDVHTFSYLFRAYRARALRDIVQIYGHPVTREPGFPAAVELLLKLSRSGVAVAEVPTTNDWNRRRGSSKLRVIPVVLAYARLAINHLLDSVRPRRRPSSHDRISGQDDLVEVLDEPVTNSSGH